MQRTRNDHMSQILKELKKYASVKRRKANMWFFKTGVGQYGEGDKFMGVSNPDARRVAGKFTSANFPALRASLHSPIHEERLVALLILVWQYEKAKGENTKKVREGITKFYLQNLGRVNNWDLVDLSSHRIVGRAILENILEEKVLDKLANSKNMWHRRVAIISTFVFIKEKKFGATLRIAKKLLADHEDLTHKAVGWALREVWKKDMKVCEEFLLANYSALPRTTLRYAIERMPEQKRKKFLNFKK